MAAIDIPSELGSGIRDLQTIEAYLDLGINRVILGTIAKENLDLVKEACRLFPGRIVMPRMVWWRCVVGLM